SDDVYSEGGQAGKRPDRALTVYCNKLKKLFPDSVIIAGGIEASLRRFAHYDYWDDRVMPSVLLDSKADLIIYGMGEKPLFEILSLIKKGVPAGDIKDVRGTLYAAEYDSFSAKLKEKIAVHEAVFCPTAQEVMTDKIKYIKAFNIQTENNDPYSAKAVIQKHGSVYVVQNPPAFPLTVAEVDAVYALPYERTYHPMYIGGIPAITEVKYSLTSSRGCFGGCNYCALNYHQGKIIQKRSKESILAEAERFLGEKDFKGIINDVGGPTANFRNQACAKQKTAGACTKKDCIGFGVCKNLDIDHSEYLDVLKSLRELDGVRKVFVRSGIRYDYLMYDGNESFFDELVKYHISGQLKVAPEHCADSVLKLMNKPQFKLYEAFRDKFYAKCKRYGKEQYLVPYFISSHPGSTLNDAVALAVYLKSIGSMPEQVQDFYPTPSTKSTTMFYTELNPDTMESVYVAKDAESKKMQRALLQYRKKENYDIVKKALITAGRSDLIGFSPDCLIKPLKEEITALKQNITDKKQKITDKKQNTTDKKARK
ncbi:MAG: YgiQ family radical SAM protein, partial [Clostridiales bacterium]|nr:YgiQ family radical SAM protein [Clostridiales bacterium]